MPESYRRGLAASLRNPEWRDELADNPRTALALAGCTTLEIAAVTGHSPKDVDAIQMARATRCRGIERWSSDKQCSARYLDVLRRSSCQAR